MVNSNSGSRVRFTLSRDLDRVVSFNALSCSWRYHEKGAFLDCLVSLPHNCKNKNQEYPCNGMLKCSRQEDYPRVRTFSSGTEQMPVWMNLFKRICGIAKSLFKMNHYTYKGMISFQDAKIHVDTDSSRVYKTPWPFDIVESGWISLCFLNILWLVTEDLCFCLPLGCRAEIHTYMEWMGYGKQLACSDRAVSFLMWTCLS